MNRISKLDISCGHITRAIANGFPFVAEGNQQNPLSPSQLLGIPFLRVAGRRFRDYVCHSHGKLEVATPDTIWPKKNENRIHGPLILDNVSSNIKDNGVLTATITAGETHGVDPAYPIQQTHHLVLDPVAMTLRDQVVLSNLSVNLTFAALVGLHPFAPIPTDNALLYLPAQFNIGLTKAPDLLPTGELIPTSKLQIDDKNLPYEDGMISLAGVNLDHQFGGLKRDSDGYAHVFLHDKDTQTTYVYSFDRAFNFVVIFKTTKDGKTLYSVEPYTAPAAGDALLFSKEYQGLHPRTQDPDFKQHVTQKIPILGHCSGSESSSLMGNVNMTIVPNKPWQDVRKDPRWAAYFVQSV